MKTRQIVLEILVKVEHENTPALWNFLNALYMAISDSAYLDPQQENVLVEMLQEFVYAPTHNTLSDTIQRLLLVTQIATWVHTASALNKTGLRY